MNRPTVSVFNHKDEKDVKGELTLPRVFETSLRQDIVQFVHDNLSRNSRQAHGIDPRAGMKHSAKSWGTGRAVARIPRISGSGTHRSGQGAYGNMCRKGRMAFPLQKWRRWHRRVNLKQRRQALASAIAATGITSLVLARGHRVMRVPELPLVLDDDVSKIAKTREALTVLRRFGVGEDLERVLKSRKIKTGKSKVRGSRYTQRRGPLFVVTDECKSLIKALRNLPGVDTVNINRLNIRLLAPGGQMGRFCIYTESAMRELANQFGSLNGGAKARKGFVLRREFLKNPDISSIINSDEIQSVLRDKKCVRAMHPRLKRNPLKNKALMDKLNPFAAQLRTRRQKKIQKNKTQAKQHKAQAQSMLKTMEQRLADEQARNYDEYTTNVELTKI